MTLEVKTATTALPHQFQIRNLGIWEQIEIAHESRMIIEDDASRIAVKREVFCK